MKQYSFLVKPLFYILTLLFATWLVIKIEKISPSDFGEDSPDSINQRVHSEIVQDNKQYLYALCLSFKDGAIDSMELKEKLTLYLEVSKNASAK